MFARQKVEELLIVAKTYPLPSNKYRETVCVAAINREGEMRRLYPIPFRFISGDVQFKKWEWIRGIVGPPNDDRRPESRRLDIYQVEKLNETISTNDGWQERRSWIEPRLSPSFDALEQRRQNSGETLGFVRPSRFLGLDITPRKDAEWTENELVRLKQEGLFDTDEMRARPLLRKVPVDFHYRYQCETPDGTIERRHMITDWEAGALYWNCVQSHGPNWEQPFRQKLEASFAQKDLIFMMGTMHRIPYRWLIISLIYPPKPTPTDQIAMNFD